MSRVFMFYYSLLMVTVVSVFLLIILSINTNYNSEIDYLESKVGLLEENNAELTRLIEDRGFTILSIDETNQLLSSNLSILESEYELALEHIRMLESSSRYAPQNRISDNQITIENNRVIINIPNAQTATFSNTNSMLPLLSNTARAIQIIPESTNDLNLGDVISYDFNGRTVIHRIVEIGFDENGWYAITKGDNNIQADPDKVRFNQIRRVLVAIIY